PSGCGVAGARNQVGSPSTSGAYQYGASTLPWSVTIRPQPLSAGSHQTPVCSDCALAVADRQASTAPASAVRRTGATGRGRDVKLMGRIPRFHRDSAAWGSIPAGRPAVTPANAGSTGAWNGGGSGIRTHERLPPLAVFKTAAL